MQEYFFDIILILVSGSACLYCWLLNQKLKALQNMKKGLGASIMTLSATISKTSIAAQEAKLSAAESVAHLRKLLVDVETSIPKIDVMLENLEQGSQRTISETKAMQEELVATLRPLLEEAHDSAGVLSKIITEVDQYTGRTVSPAANEGHDEPRKTDLDEILRSKAVGLLRQ